MVSHAPAPSDRLLVGEAEELLDQRTGCWLPPLSVALVMLHCFDKVDKEMLRHAPDRLDLKSPRWGAAAATDSMH